MRMTVVDDNFARGKRGKSIDNSDSIFYTINENMLSLTIFFTYYLRHSNATIDSQSEVYHARPPRHAIPCHPSRT